MCVLDRQAKIVRANHALASRLDKQPSEIEDRPSADVLPEVPSDVWRTALFARHTTPLGEVVLAGEVCEAEAHPLTDPDGKADGVVICARIVTKERRLRDEVRQALRLASVGELLVGTAYSFGEMLKSIEGTLGKLRRSSEDGESLTQALSHIRSASQTVERLLSFSCGFDHKKDRVSLRQVTESALALCLNHPAAKRKTVKNLVQPGIPTVDAQQGPLEEAIFNLVINALQATSPGGHVTLSARVLESQGCIELRVIDDGCGMKPNVLKHAFEPFYSTKGGTGLGLSASAAAIHGMGGVLTVDTTPSKGTIFTIRLPLTQSTRQRQTRLAA